MHRLEKIQTNKWNERSKNYKLNLKPIITIANDNTNYTCYDYIAVYITY